MVTFTPSYPFFLSPFLIVSWQDLKDFMRKAGEVTFTAAHQQRRNEGIAEFANKDSLERALDELDGSEIHGMKIRYAHHFLLVYLRFSFSHALQYSRITLSLLIPLPIVSAGPLLMLPPTFHRRFKGTHLVVYSLGKGWWIDLKFVRTFLVQTSCV